MIYPDAAIHIGARVIYTDEAGEERGKITRIVPGAVFVLYDDGREMKTEPEDLRWET